MAQGRRPFVDHYATLGISPAASAAEVRAAYAKRSRRARGTDTARVEKAMEVLGDPGKRQRYDRLRAERLGGRSRSAVAARSRAAAVAATPARRRQSWGRMLLPWTGFTEEVREPTEPLDPPLRETITTQLHGLPGIWTGILAAIVLLFIATECLPWVTAAPVVGPSATYTPWSGPASGAYYTVGAVLALVLEVVLYLRQRWWVARALSIVVFGTAMLLDASVGANPITAAQLLRIPLVRSTVAVNGVPTMASVFAALALILLVVRALSRVARARREARVDPGR